MLQIKVLLRPQLDPDSEVPLYQQLQRYFSNLIGSGSLKRGERLPATRELAGELGLNRTTVSAAYELLEAEGLISGHVGRGSFVSWKPTADSAAGDTISFAASRPSELLFPIEEFRQTCLEVISGSEALAILQLGASTGYGPLRRYLLEEARTRGDASS